MVTGERPAVAFVKHLLSPAAIVATFVLCTLVYHVTLSGEYVLLAVLVFLISAQIFDDVDVFHSWRDIRPAAAGRKILLDWLIVVAILLFLGFATKLSGYFSRRV